MRRPAITLALLLVLAGTLSVGATASPQPRPVCGVCGGGLVLAADETDTLRGLTVERSVATIQVHDDGSATWRVTTRIGNASAISHLNDDPDAVDRLVRDALGYGTVERPHRNISASIDGATIRVRFTDPDAARRMPGDVLIVEYLHARGYDTWPVIAADRLTIVGPAGTTVTNDPPGARVEGRTATWEGNASVPLYEAPRVERDAYVAFAAADGAAGLRTTLAIALATAPIVVGVLGSIHLPPLLLLALGLLAVIAIGRRVLRSSAVDTHREVAIGVAGLGGLAVVTLALGAVLPLFEGNRWVLELGGLYLALGGIAYWRGARTRVRELVAAGLLVQVAVVLALAVTLPSEYTTQSEALRRGVHEAVRLLPLLAMPVLGAAAVGGDRRRTAGGLLVVLGAFVVAELSVVWPTQRPFGLVVVLFAAGAAGVVLLGSPLFLLGGVTRRSDDERRAGSASVDIEPSTD